MRIILKEKSKDWSKFINRFEKDPDKIAIIERMVKELLAADNIKRSISNHSYTAFLVPKGKKKYMLELTFVSSKNYYHNKIKR